MKILHAATCGAAVWCWAAVSALPAAADEPASCYSLNSGFLLSNGDAVSKPGTNIDPAYKTHTVVPYSKYSQRDGERGTAIFLVTIGTDGAPTDVAITRSSASRRLNNDAMEHIKTHWRWPSPMKSCGQNTAQMSVTVIWNRIRPASYPDPEFHLKIPSSAYPAGALQKLEDGATLLMVETDEQGAVTGGRVIDSSGFSDLDDQALTIMKNSPTLLKGQPAGKHVISADWQIPPGTLPSNGETVLVTGSQVPG